MSKQIKNNLSVVLLLLTFILLTGCEFKDIDKDVFVAMIAVDKSDEAGKSYKITLKLYEPTSSFKQMPEPTYSYITESGETISEAVRLLESYSDKKLEFGHSKLIVIGEDLIKEDKSKEILDFFLRRPDIQMISWMAVGRPSAEEIIRLVPQGETAAYPELFNYFDDNGTESQYIITTYLFDFRRNMKSAGVDPILPIIEINHEESHFEINKSIVFRDKKEPYELNSLDTSLFNILSNSTDNADFYIKEDEHYLIVKIDSVKAKKKVQVQNNSNLKLDIEINLSGYIAESKKQLVNKQLPYYNKLFKKEAEKQFNDFFSKMIKGGYDPLGLELDYKSQTFHNRQMSNEEWEEALENAQINIIINPGLKSTGVIQ